jgi:hypothetical protein
VLNIPEKESLLPLTSEKVREKQVLHAKEGGTHMYMEEADMLLKVCVRNPEKSYIERAEHSERVNP